MTGGKPWTDEENRLLLSMIAEDYSFQEILDSAKFPDRTAVAVRVQVQRLSASSQLKAEHSPKIIATEPSKNNMPMERVVKLFSSAFEQICASTYADRFMLERFRIIFQAAKDYVPLLAGFEKWDKMEKMIDELAAKVAVIQSMDRASKTSEREPGNQVNLVETPP